MRSISLLLLAIWLVSGAREARAEIPEIRNFVLIFTDDQRFDSLWAMPLVQDRLISRGVEFDVAVTPTPDCCPSRGSLLSGGFYSHDTGMLVLEGINKAPFVDTGTLPVQLQQVGYKTFMVGKYLNGYSQISPYIPPGWDRFVGWSGGTTMVLGSSDANPGVGVPQPEFTGLHIDHFLFRTLEFIDDTLGEKRFIYMPTTLPHWPAIPDPADTNLFPTFVYRGRGYGETDLSDKPHNNGSLWWTKKFDSVAEQDDYNRQVLQSLQAVDRAVAAIFDRLDQLGEIGQTVFMFTSDNGFMWGEHQLWGKLKPYEESIRVPLVVVVPGVTPRFDADHMVAINQDLPATVQELAGLPHAGDGISLIPVLENPVLPGREETLIEWLGQPPWSGLRTQTATESWKYVERTNETIELYDLIADPYELESLHDDPSQQARIDAFATRLDELRGLSIAQRFQLPKPTIDVPFDYTIPVRGGVAPYTWELVGGALPPGLQLDTANGRIHGTATTGVTAQKFDLRVTSAAIATWRGLPQTHVMQNLSITVKGDVDEDGVADGVDVCPNDPDPLQEDADGDGIGDACDDLCHNGLDDDDDGAIDAADLGCGGYSDTESPECQDGIDNDGDGGVDFDGGASALGAAIGDADPHCVTAVTLAEKPRKGCGLGLALGLGLLGVAAWRRLRPRR